MRVARLQRAEEILVVPDLQIGMQAALQQDPRAAESLHRVDLSADFLKGQDVAVFRAERAIARAKRAVFRAKIRVVDVAVDLVGHDARIVFLQARLVRGHSEADEVIGFKHFERLLFRQCQVASSSPGRGRSSAAPLQSLQMSRGRAKARPYNFKFTTSRLRILRRPSGLRSLSRLSQVLPRAGNTAPGRGGSPGRAKSRCCRVNTIRVRAGATPNPVRPRS